MRWRSCFASFIVSSSLSSCDLACSGVSTIYDILAALCAQSRTLCPLQKALIVDGAVGESGSVSMCVSVSTLLCLEKASFPFSIHLRMAYSALGAMCIEESMERERECPPKTKIGREGPNEKNKKEIVT